VASVRELQSEFTALSIRLIVCDKTLGANVKVSNLAQMLAEARYQRLLVNDSDIRVEADYLSRVMAPLANPKVGMVTCLYRGVPAATLGSRIESLGISTDFCAGVLAARELEGGLKFGLGSTMAFRRDDLEKIGGFESFADYLADDYELGRRIAGLGLEVRLSDVVVETNLPAYRAAEFLSHQLRWARGVRDSRSGGYFGLVLTYGLLWSCALVAASRGALFAWVLAGTTLFLRTAVALVVGRSVLRDRQILRQLWLLPLRDLVTVGVWIASLAGHTVSWRGDRFELKNGKLIRVVS
jgi:ceramide glucosyltransferase